MAVVQAWYPHVPRTARTSALSAYWRGLIDVRSRMNLELYRQDLETRDPKYLFDRVMALEKQITDAAAQQARIMAAREQGRWKVIEDTMAGTLNVQKAGIDARARVAEAKIQGRSRLQANVLSYNQERMAERTVDADVERMMADRLNAVGREAGVGGQPPTQAVAGMLQEALAQAKAAPGTEKAAAIAASAYEMAVERGMNTAAAAIMADPTYGTGGTPPAQYLRDTYGDILVGPALEEFLQRGTAGGVSVPQQDWKKLLRDVGSSVDAMSTGGFGPTGTQPLPSEPQAQVYVTDETGQQMAIPAQSLGSVPASSQVYTDQGWIPLSEAAEALNAGQEGAPTIVVVQQPAAAQPRPQRRIGQQDPVDVMGDRVARLQVERDKYMDLYEAARGQERVSAARMAPGIGLNYMTQQPFHRTGRRQADIDRIAEQGRPERVQWAMDDLARMGPDRAREEQIRMGGAPAESSSPVWGNLQGSGQTILSWLQGELDTAGTLLDDPDPGQRAEGLRRMGWAARVVDHIEPSLGPAGQEWATNFRRMAQGAQGDAELLSMTALGSRGDLDRVRRQEDDPPVEYLFAQDLGRALEERDPDTQSRALRRVTEDWQAMPDTLTGGPFSTIRGFGRVAQRAMDAGDVMTLAKSMAGARSRALDITDEKMREQVDGPRDRTERAVMNELVQEAGGIAQPRSTIPLDRPTPAAAPPPPPRPVALPADRIPDDDDEAIREVARAAGIDPDEALRRARSTAIPGGGYGRYVAPPPDRGAMLDVTVAPGRKPTGWGIPSDFDDDAMRAVLESFAEPKGR